MKSGSVWGAPLAMAVVSAIGLLGALVGDGGWNWLSWVGLGVPCVAGTWLGWRGRGPR
jgi:hypothetical protein